MLQLALLVVVLTGCDMLFQLDHIPDASPDGLRSDDATDSSVDSGSDGCPATYFELNNSKYRIESQDETWLTAEAKCRNEGPGIHLVVIGDDAERKALANITSSLVWLGFSDRVTQQTWKWITDEPTMYPPFTSPPWGTSEPSNMLGEDCGALGMDDVLRDRMCSETQAYVCECDGRSVVPGNF